MSVTHQEYGESVDLQQLYPFRMKFRFIEVGPVEVENLRTSIAEPSGASAPISHLLNDLAAFLLRLVHSRAFDPPMASSMLCVPCQRA